MKKPHPNQKQKENQSSLVDRWLARAKNHPVIAILIFVGVVIIGLSQLTDAIQKLGKLVFRDETAQDQRSQPLVPDWKAIRGEWEGPDKKGVIRGKAKNFDALYLFAETLTDFVFSAKVQAIDREASLALRMTPDGKNGYLVIFVPVGSNWGNPGLYLAKRVNNKHTFPRSEGMYIPLEKWVKLTVKTQGPRILVSLDDRLVFDFLDTDQPIFMEGRLGFRIYGDPSATAAANFSEIHLAY